ncbi:TetR/AcrR family transcriptional regulator [uncultured Microbacterium sp.]|jgi:AcrR family transcriptional regulator|uniref:TetR/AcrR family transcriptional regulator n=1 Tax=uncultured Microbacterium sp. TaxID=191216 RepID=UPI0025D52E63|nr:TetR/AcrR family transcriptional regulator [uncultured Microbacterium sp.]
MADTMRMSGRRDRNMREKRDRIFAAASDLFAERGFSEVTTQELSDRAEVAAGTLFRYAASKSELLLMVYNEEFRAAIDEGERRAAPVAETVAAIGALVIPTIERSVRTPENSIAYQRELLFGSAVEPHRAEGVELVYRLEGLIVGRLNADPRRRRLAVDAAFVRLAGETVFGIVNLTIARLSDAPVELSDIERNLRVQIKQVVDGLFTEKE